MGDHSVIYTRFWLKAELFKKEKVFPLSPTTPITYLKERIVRIIVIIVRIIVYVLIVTTVSFQEKGAIGGVPFFRYLYY